MAHGQASTTLMKELIDKRREAKRAFQKAISSSYFSIGPSRKDRVRKTHTDVDADWMSCLPYQKSLLDVEFQIIQLAVCVS